MVELVIEIASELVEDGKLELKEDDKSELVVVCKVDSVVDIVKLVDVGKVWSVEDILVELADDDTRPESNEEEWIGMVEDDKEEDARSETELNEKVLLDTAVELATDFLHGVSSIQTSSLPI
jgi:hypothetical protein